MKALYQEVILQLADVEKNILIVENTKNEKDIPNLAMAAYLYGKECLHKTLEAIGQELYDNDEYVNVEEVEKVLNEWDEQVKENVIETLVEYEIVEE